MIVVGVDPGSRFTGYAVLEVGTDIVHLQSGVIRLHHEETAAERLALLHLEFSKVIKTWQPDQMAIEKVFLGKNPDSAFVLGQARGICMAVAGAEKIEVFEYATRTVKKAVTGRGAAEKEELRMVLQNFLGTTFPSLDQSDSVGIAYCHGRQIQTKAVIEKANQKNVQKNNKRTQL